MYDPAICLEEIRETTKYTIQDSQSPGRYLNLRSPEFEEGLTN
jgi:hypothetical protein